MATIVHAALARYLLFQREACEPRQCVKGDPKDTVPVPFHELLENTTHTVLKARYFQFQREACEPRQCVKGDPKDTVPVPFHEPLENTTHTVLKVQGPVSPGPKRFSVNVFNSSNSMKLLVNLRSSDTIGNLQQEVLKLCPDLGESLNLVYNGKPVQPHQTLSELQVKPGVTFFTYQKCRGG